MVDCAAASGQVDRAIKNHMHQEPELWGRKCYPQLFYHHHVIDCAALDSTKRLVDT